MSVHRSLLRTAARSGGFTATRLEHHYSLAAAPFDQARRQLHGGKSHRATPVAHPTIPGPPPDPPQVPVGHIKDTTARKKSQAELLKKAQALKGTPSKPAAALLQKRFWKEVGVKEVDDGLQIVLDNRPVRTAYRQTLTLPREKRGLATAIALEWELLVSAQQALRQHYIPMTSLASRALDIRHADQHADNKVRQDIIKMMMRYLSTDTLLCWAPERSAYDESGPNSDHQDEPTQSLRSRQKAIAEPIIAHLKSHVFPGAEIEPILDEDSIMPKAQSEMTKQIIRGWLSGLPAFELAALERGVLATKSLLIAVRLLVDWSLEFKHLQSEDRKFGIKEAAEASNTEVAWQTGMWGEVEDTHDVEKEDIARQLGSVVVLVS